MLPLRSRLGSRATALIGLPLIAAALALVFATNALHTTDQNFFLGWDRESQALVLATIQEARSGSAPAWGLAQASPDLFAPYLTFDSQHVVAQRYSFYPSQLGLQSRLFFAAYTLGATSVGTLTSLEAAIFAIVFVALMAALWATVSRVLAVLVGLSAALSPWVVSAAHNLYWVPWTWILPAIAASAVLHARGRLARSAVFVAIVVSTALKAACGYEFITTVVLLAAGMPLLSAAVGRASWRHAVRSAIIVVALALLGFLLVLVVHAFLAGDGSFPAGVHEIVMDATKRTYGAPRAGLDATTQLSLTLSPWTVLARYLFGWQTDLFSIGVGTPLQLQSSHWGLIAVIVIAMSAVVVTALRKDTGWVRLAAIVIIGLAPPLSWYILAKSHAFSAVAVCFVLWYLLAVPLLLWVVALAIQRLPAVDVGVRRSAVWTRAAIDRRGGGPADRSTAR